MEEKIVAIIGVGLIGGSMAARIRSRGLFDRIIGVDNDPVHCEQALALRLVDEICPMLSAIRAARLVILATPVDSMLQLLPAILDEVGDQVVMDTGSTKRKICEKIKDHPRRGRYVATHPMWGAEFHGPAAARAESFENRVAVICEQHLSDAGALQTVRVFYQGMGMRLTEMGSENHDMHTAYISHLPHVISYALANTVLEKQAEEDGIFTLASGGFDSTIRLAKSSSTIWTPIFHQNRENILSVLDEYMEELQKFRACLIIGNDLDMTRLIDNANIIRKVSK